MSEARWMYARGQQQFGPVTLEQLKQLMHTGQVQGADLVWRDGMPQWVAAQSVPELHGGDAAAAPIAARVAVSAAKGQPAVAMAVPYYTAGGGMPPRAVERLKGQARPVGDVGDWPLDDGRVTQFAETARLRKQILGGANLYNLMFLLTLLSTVILLVVMIVGAATTGGARRSSTLLGTVPAMFMCAGFCVLYFFTTRGTKRAHRWAPLTMLILFLCCGGLYLLLVGITAASNQRDAAPAALGLLIGLIFVAAFAAVSWRAWAAIPKYLAQPAWCQELVLTAEAKKKKGT